MKTVTILVNYYIQVATNHKRSSSPFKSTFYLTVLLTLSTW